MLLMLFSCDSLANQRPMTAEEYKNMVNNLGKQNKDSLSKEVSQQYNAQKPLQTTAPTVTTDKASANQNNTSITQSPAQNLGATTPAQPVPTVTPAPQPGSPQTQQAFTGFGNPNEKNSSQNHHSSDDQSGVWKIQY